MPAVACPAAGFRSEVHVIDRVGVVLRRWPDCAHGAKENRGKRGDCRSFRAVRGATGWADQLATTRIDRRWGRAERHIAQLCDQVAAYYQLEQLYKEELAKLDPAGRSAKTIMEDMRTCVAQSGEFERPSMTSLSATRLRREWT